MKKVLIIFLLGALASCVTYSPKFNYNTNLKINDNTNLIGARITLGTGIDALMSRFGSPENQLDTGNETLLTFCERKDNIVDILYVLTKKGSVIDTKRTYYPVSIDSVNLSCIEALMTPEIASGKIGSLVTREEMSYKKRCEAAVPKEDVRECMTRELSEQRDLLEQSKAFARDFESFDLYLPK